MFSARVDELIEAISRGEVDDVDVAEYRAYLDVAHSEAQHPSPSPLCPPLSSLSLVRLFTSYHTVRHLVQMQDSANVPAPVLLQQLAALEAEQNEDLAKAWRVLQQPAVQALHSTQPVGGGEALAQADSAAAAVRYSDLRLLALEIAQRLKSAEYLRESFARLLQIPAQEMADEQVLAAFMTAPLLGKWRETRTLGQRLIERKGPTAMEGQRLTQRRGGTMRSLQRWIDQRLTPPSLLLLCCLRWCAEFHAAALQEALYPDYALLYIRSEDWQNAPQAAQPALAWEKFDTTQIVIRHEQVIGARPAAPRTYTARPHIPSLPPLR